MRSRAATTRMVVEVKGSPKYCTYQQKMKLAHFTIELLISVLKCSLQYGPQSAVRVIKNQGFEVTRSKMSISLETSLKI